MCNSVLNLLNLLANSATNVNGAGPPANGTVLIGARQLSATGKYSLYVLPRFRTVASVWMSVNISS